MALQPHLTLIVVSDPIQPAYEFVASLSSEPPVKNEQMCFGTVVLPDTSVLKILGMVGPKKYDFMWEILAEVVVGVVLLVDDEHEQSLLRTAQQLTALSHVSNPPPVVVGIQNTSSSKTEEIYTMFHNITHIVHEDHFLSYAPKQADDAKRILSYVLNLHSR